MSCNINNITLTPFIYYDLRFPEIFQIASKPADLIIIAANWPRSKSDQWISLLKARAIENQCYVAGINSIGIGINIAYSGNSMIVNPLGEIISFGEEGINDIIVADITHESVAEIRNTFNFKKDRKEDLYYHLNSLQKHSWIFPIIKL